MAEERVRLANELSASEVVYSNVSKNQYGSKQIFLNYTTANEKLWIQTPKMFLPFGLSTPRDQKESDEDSKKSYYVEPQFEKEDSGKLGMLHKFFQDLDEKVIEDARKNCQPWLGKAKLSREVADELYTPMLKRYKDPKTHEFTGKYPDRVKFKILPNATKVYDENQNEVDFRTALSNGCRVICVVRPNKIYFSNGKFGVSWYVFQMQVFAPDRITGYSILPEESEDDDDVVGETTTESTPTVETANETTETTKESAPETTEEQNSDEEPETTEQQNSDEETETPAEKPKRRGRPKKSDK